MLEPRTVLDSVEELLAGADGLTAIDSVGKSGAALDRVTIDGAPYVVKYLDPDVDWTIRVAQVPATAPVEVWRRGLLHALPPEIDSPIVGVASLGAKAVLLMRDVSPWLVPVGDDPIPAAQNEGFLDHMAAMHVHFWASAEAIDVVTPERRYLELSPQMAEAEAELGSDHLVPQLVARGWPLFGEVAPRAAAVVLPLAHDPRPLVAAMENTPQTFIHGNWKLDNLGTHDDGRTILFDWELPGRGAPLADVAWYLAINCRRLPVSKEQALEIYRDALHRRGVDTRPWWDRQLGLALIGALVHFGWEKALGGYDEELAWWEDRVLENAHLL
ncbi:phosphotransferase [Nocardioides marmorisolisilvae]|uniref:Aminoglycoside phosphotransferase n=1 Tax=Nocardioides marmorisolisilvae TaxID=1542737 RepID=A0A3N0DRU0_9ACTN|nr:phosphotransferase [Nocardioides marmorisolisilvae]RNL78342.1 aminoglycoside phosphotransferase [Nocardioides marmorisolisilvae]